MALDGNGGATRPICVALHIVRCAIPFHALLSFNKVLRIARAQNFCKNPNGDICFLLDSHKRCINFTGFLQDFYLRSHKVCAPFAHRPTILGIFVDKNELQLQFIPTSFCPNFSTFGGSLYFFIWFKYRFTLPFGTNPL